MIAFKSLHINVIQNSLSKFMEIKDNVLKQHILKFTHKFEVFENFMEKKMLRIFFKQEFFICQSQREGERDLPSDGLHPNWL